MKIEHIQKLFGATFVSGLALASLVFGHLELQRRGQKKRKRCVKIALTGGPCGGKTSCIGKIREYLAEKDIRVVTVPEVPTLFCNNGSSFDDLTTDRKLVEYQECQLNTQLVLEETMMRLGSLSDQPLLLLVDRGTMDGAAYMERDQWLEVLQRTGYGRTERLLWERYDAVIHLVSAAIGTETVYGSKTNEVRFETVDEARAIDHTTKAAWMAHPNLHVVDNSTDFSGKLQRVYEIVDSVLSSL